MMHGLIASVSVPKSTKFDEMCTMSQTLNVADGMSLSLTTFT